MGSPKLGQHFLHDPRGRRRILDLLRPEPGQVWVEIGAGRGEMTAELATRARRVVAIELDASLLRSLRERTAGLPVEIVSGDVLALDLGQLGGPRFRVYGSLPYYISSPILRRLFASIDRIQRIDVIVQREVADRICAEPRHREYGLLSVLAQLHAKPEIRLILPPAAFQPPPKVDSALLTLVPLGQTERLAIAGEDRFLRFAELCFAHKRKTLLNNLKTRYGPAAVRLALADQELGSKARAEELTVARLARLYLQLEAEPRQV